MYLWRRRATRQWWAENGETLQLHFGNRLALIQRPDRKRLLIEISSILPNELHNIVKQFGGRIDRLSRNWLSQLLRAPNPKSLKVGNRLVISRSGNLQTAVCFGSATGKPPLLVIPTTAAFGTGEHATTAMCLQMLERLTRLWNFGWSIVDFGTGSGILVLAAKRFGAKRALGIDIDPSAISTAKQNARLNKIDNVQFRLADLRRWEFPPASRFRPSGHDGKVDIVTANLFSELLIEILPKLKRTRFLILSGILRNQEVKVVRALKRNKIDIVEVRRRGKWIALLAGR
jgi:ribosomal protein L11 methyltransferase